MDDNPALALALAKQLAENAWQDVKKAVFTLGDEDLSRLFNEIADELIRRRTHEDA